MLSVIASLRGSEAPAPMLTLLLLTIGLNFYLIDIIPKGFFPQQDTGALTGNARGPQDASFAVMDNSICKLEKVIQADPASQCHCPYRRRRRIQWRSIFIALKPLDERKVERQRLSMSEAQAECASGCFLVLRRRRICASEGDPACHCTNTQFSR